MNINGNWFNIARLREETLYSSAYLVATHQGYTKHYYAGSERIASAIGLGGLSTINQPITLMTYEHKWEFKSKALNEVMTRTIEQCLNHRFISKKTLANLNNLNVATSGTMLRYFYHPDHLGSSSWITDGSGNAIQHLHYLPFGEDLLDQRNSSWNAPYTFSGKEKDAETGYSYFGARYYDSGLSIWLSVDPMSDKYPSMSPYNYCANNPVMLVDPDGRTFILTGPDVKDAVNQINARTSFAFSVSLGKDGRTLEYHGIALSKKDRLLKKMIKEEFITFEMVCRNDNRFPLPNGSFLTSENGAAFGGVEFEEEYGAHAIQYICPRMLEDFDAQFNVYEYGETMAHESAELFESGKKGLDDGASYTGYGDKNPIYNYCHNKANKIALANVSEVETTIKYKGYEISIPTPTPKNHFNNIPSVKIVERKVGVPSGKTRCK